TQSFHARKAPSGRRRNAADAEAQTRRRPYLVDEPWGSDFHVVLSTCHRDASTDVTAAVAV
ncbi:MAG: hypothetical protein ACXVRQ_08855, partial [Gaiellaceae bacterium]